MNYGHSLCLARFVAPRIDSAVESHSWALHFGSASIVITTAFAICHCRLVDHGKRSFNSLRARFKSRSKRVANARARECSCCSLRCLHMINLAFFACLFYILAKLTLGLAHTLTHPPTHSHTQSATNTCINYAKNTVNPLRFLCVFSQVFRFFSPLANE